MGYLVNKIIDNYRELIGGKAVGAADNKVATAAFKILVNGVTDLVVDLNFPVLSTQTQTQRSLPRSGTIPGATCAWIDDAVFAMPTGSFDLPP